MTKELELGEEKGYWTILHAEHTGRPYGITLTDKGKLYFKDFWCNQNDGAWEFSAAVRRHIVQVTGITGNDKDKEVELVWIPDLNGLPIDLRQLFEAPRGTTSTVHMKLYDDGWRIVNVN